MILVDRRTALVAGGALILGGAGTAALGYRKLSSMDEYDAAVGASRAALAENPALNELIRFATLAPNGHNTQPWRFRASPGRIDILPDFSRRTPVVDSDDHHIFVSLGAAAENLVLAASARGHSSEIDFDPSEGGVVSAFLNKAVPVASPLFEAISHRQSTRADYDGRPVGAFDLHQLAVAATVPGVDVVIITDHAQIAQITELIVVGNTAQMTDAAFLAELMHWLRFNPREALTKGDGLFSAASGSPIVPTWLGPFLFNRFASVARQNDKYVRQLRSSAGIAVFVGAQADREHWVKVGRSCQRFQLQATALGMKHAFVNQPVEVAKLRPELASSIGLSGRRPDIVMRFGWGRSLPFSARRPVSDVTS